MDQRQQVIEGLNQKKVQVVIATGQLIGEGFDCQNLVDPVSRNADPVQRPGIAVSRPGPASGARQKIGAGFRLRGYPRGHVNQSGPGQTENLPKLTAAANSASSYAIHFDSIIFRLRQISEAN